MTGIHIVVRIHSGNRNEYILDVREHLTSLPCRLEARVCSLERVIVGENDDSRIWMKITHRTCHGRNVAGVDGHDGHDPRVLKG